ncbi:MAG TPA: hypothetical protein VGQ33_17155 [Vicinamibacteria bacterium]|nr:hypothetical protein [Vicinamibacteria bacterium]
MANLSVAVFTKATIPEASEAAVRTMAAAVQTQIQSDFAAAWNITADLVFFGSAQKVPKDMWQIGIFDNADQAGALGYHDVTNEGLPLGKVFARTTLVDGGKISVTLSHEILEMLADPDINLTAFVEAPSGGGRLYAYEVCDAVEADDLGYDVDGITVSDFVTPAWFQSFRKKGSTDFSFRKNVKEPFALAPGGYIGYYDVQSGSGWQQLTPNEKPTFKSRAPRGSRRERRRTPRRQWMASTSR